MKNKNQTSPLPDNEVVENLANEIADKYSKTFKDLAVIERFENTNPKCTLVDGKLYVSMDEASNFIISETSLATAKGYEQGKKETIEEILKLGEVHGGYRDAIWAEEIKQLQDRLLNN